MTAVTAYTVADAVRAALRSRFDDGRHAAKAIAARVGTTPRAAEDWLQGENAPRAAELVRLMAEFDEVYLAVCSLAGRKPLDEGKRQAVAAALRLLEG